MKKIDCLFVGVYAYTKIVDVDVHTKKATLLREESFRNLKRGLFSGPITLENYGKGIFKFSGNLEEDSGLSKIEGEILGPFMKFKKEYTSGLFKSQIVEYEVTQINEENISTFVGSWKNSSKVGRATCSIVFEE
jgi:hypothetical protein